MGVLGVANLRPKPGRVAEAYGDTIKVARISKEVSPNTALWRTLFGGEDTFRLTLTIEHDTFAENLASEQTFFARPDWGAILDSYDDTSFPYVSSAASSLFMSVPGREQPLLGPSTGRPRAAITALYAYTPAVLEWLATVAQQGERLGFVSHQYGSLAAGARPPVLLVAQIFPDRVALGAGLDALAGDATLLAGVQAVGSALLGRWLLEEIPL